MEGVRVLTEQSDVINEAENVADQYQDFYDKAIKMTTRLQSIADEQQQRIENLHAYLEEIETKLLEKYGITTEQLCDIEDAQAFV